VVSKQSQVGLSSHDEDIVKRTFVDWLKILVLLLDEVAAVFLVVLILNFFGVQIPFAVKVIIGLIAGILVIVAHIAIIPSFHFKQTTGREGMIGRQGTVVEPLSPSGAVMFKGERWKAKSTDGDIELGEDVEITKIERLTLTVRRYTKT
jgi:membrane-bound ClpP family serine protease